MGMRQAVGAASGEGADAQHQPAARADTADSKAAPKSGFPGQAELDASSDHFGGGRVGAPQKYKRPFTRQLKDDTAARFPIDKVYFDRADAVQAEVIRSYLRLRVITLALFCLLLVIQLCLFEAGFVTLDPRDADGTRYALYPVRLAAAVLDAVPLPRALSAICLILTVGGAFFGMRLGVRWLWFRELSRDAHQLSFQVFTRLDEINTRVTEVCAKVRDRVGMGGDWPERARKWIAIALWNAKRGEYLDRFITTVIWKVQTSIQTIEDFSLWTKLILSLTAVAVAVSQARIPSLVFGLTIFAQTYFFWHRLGRQQPDFWTIQFRKSAPADDHKRETYVDKISGVVENIVHEALSKEFGQGGKQNG